MTRSSCCLCYNQELYAATFVRVETVAALIRRCIYFLRSSSFSGVVFDFHSMNVISLDLSVTAHVLLKQQRSFDVIDLFLLGIYNSIPSKIIFETIFI